MYCESSTSSSSSWQHFHEFHMRQTAQPYKKVTFVHVVSVCVCVPFVVRYIQSRLHLQLKVRFQYICRFHHIVFIGFSVFRLCFAVPQMNFHTPPSSTLTVNHIVVIGSSTYTEIVCARVNDMQLCFGNTACEAKVTRCVSSKCILLRVSLCAVFGKLV